jgi:hypothetical protein
MTTKALRILLRLDFPGKTYRMWEGSGPYLDPDGRVWLGTGPIGGLDAIEAALNGVATSLSLTVSGADPNVADIAWQETQDGYVIGASVELLVQPCDAAFQPEGEPDVKFTGRIDNIVFSDAARGESMVSEITIECTNRFGLRTLNSGRVLSDSDQKARSAVLNPEAAPDRFCERVPGLLDKTIVWPRFS